MMQHRSKQQQCKRTCRFELLEQRMTLSGMGLIAANTVGSHHTSQLDGHSHQQARESAQHSYHSSELSPEQKRTNHHHTSHHSELHPPRRNAHTGSHPVDHQNLVQTRHFEPHHSTIEISGQKGGLPSAAAFPAISQELTEQPARPVFTANELLVNPSSATLESHVVVITQRPSTPLSSAPSKSDSFVLKGSTDDTAFFDNPSDDHSSSSATASSSQTSSVNPTTKNTLTISDPLHLSANNLPQARVLTAEEASRSDLPAENLLTSTQSHTTEEAADTLFTVEFIRHESQAQVTADSIYQQLANLEDLLQTLAISHSSGHPISNANVVAEDKSNGAGHNKPYTNHQASTLDPMILLMPTDPAYSGLAATAKLNATRLQHTGQWSTPLGRHRAITSIILKQALLHEPTLNGSAGMSEDLQPLSPVDPNSKSTKFTPTAPRGFAILCCVMIIPIIRRKYQQRHKPPYQSQEN